MLVLAVEHFATAKAAERTYDSRARLLFPVAENSSSAAMPSVLGTDGGVKAVEHVDDDGRHGQIVDEEDREEVFTKALFTFYCTCGEVSCGFSSN